MLEPTKGRVASLSLNVGHRMPMRIVDNVTFVGGRGIEGDRHYTHSPVRQRYQVLLVEQEILESFDLSPGVIRENVTTYGVELSSLTSGHKISLGKNVVLEISKPCTPCSRLDEIRQGLQNKLEGKRGMLAAILKGGIVKIGDSVYVTKGDSQNV